MMDNEPRSIQVFPSKSLAVKLLVAAKAITSVEKRGKNKEQGYKFATIEDVLRSARTALLEAGIVLVPQLRNYTVTPPSEGRKSSMVTVDIEYGFTDTETGEHMTVRWAGQGMDTSDKGLNKAYTAALKYAMINVLQIPIGDDPEDDPATDRDTAPARSAAPARSERTRSARKAAEPTEPSEARTAAEDEADPLKPLYAAARERGVTTVGDLLQGVTFILERDVLSIRDITKDDLAVLLKRKDMLAAKKNERAQQQTAKHPVQGAGDPTIPKATYLSIIKGLAVAVSKRFPGRKVLADVNVDAADYVLCDASLLAEIFGDTNTRKLDDLTIEELDNVRQELEAIIRNKASKEKEA